MRKSSIRKSETQLSLEEKMFIKIKKMKKKMKKISGNEKELVKISPPKKKKEVKNLYKKKFHQGNQVYLL